MKALFNLSKILFFVIVIISCRNKNSIAPEVVNYKYEQPIQIDDGWDVSSIEEVGLSVDKLTDMINQLDDDPNHRIHSILISKDSKLVFEKYFNGFLFNANYVQAEGDLIKYEISTLHYLSSVSKSVTSLLLGIAIDQGAEINTSEPIINYYPEYNSILSGEKSNITIEHLLTMSAGLS